jgi:sialidase-1
MVKIVGSALLLALSAVAVQAAEGQLEKAVLFEHDSGGYMLYRIPGIVITRTGTILAYAEARKSDRSDWHASDIILRRSTDGGQTWSAPSVIGAIERTFPKNPAAVVKKLGLGPGAGVTYNNPVAIADRNGAVHFLFCVEYMRAFYMRSDDDGKTFSEPVEITAAFASFRRHWAWVVLATEPGHGIQLKRGRLVVPVWLSLGSGGGAHGDSVTSVIYSDNHGATWKAGEIAVPNTEETTSPNETSAVQLSDGGVMMNVRSQSKAQRRIVVYSKDGARHWSAPVFHAQLPEPVCFACMARLPEDRLLYVSPDSGGRERRNLTVRVSNHEGATWNVQRVLEAGPSAYADMAVLPDGAILCFYETGKDRPYETLTLGRFRLNGQARRPVLLDHYDGGAPEGEFLGLRIQHTDLAGVAAGL